MLLTSHPSEALIERFLERARQSGYTYSEVGATAGLIPPHFTPDHNRVLLGRGSATWSKAVDAIQRWEMFSIGWVKLCWPSTPIETGQNVAVLARWLNLYWLNACRIVYVVEETAPVRRFGFAYGTLEDHAESGEERFTVAWNLDNDEIWYDILAFSRPNQFLARVGYPLARRLQKEFAAGSKQAMVKAAR